MNQSISEVNIKNKTYCLSVSTRLSYTVRAPELKRVHGVHKLITNFNKQPRRKKESENDRQTILSQDTVHLPCCVNILIEAGVRSFCRHKRGLLYRNSELSIQLLPASDHQLLVPEKNSLSSHLRV